MKHVIIFLAVFQVVTTLVLAQAPLPPPVNNKFTKLTFYPELSSYIELIGKQPGLLKVEIIGQTVQGRNLYSMKFSSSEFGMDTP